MHEKRQMKRKDRGFTVKWCHFRYTLFERIKT